MRGEILLLFAISPSFLLRCFFFFPMTMMTMNVGGDFISGAGQRNDMFDRMRRRLDVYRQRHVVNANHFNDRYSEETEKQRQETAAYHRKWMDSKSKRTTGKAKVGVGQRGDGLSATSGCTKLKRKSQNDEQMLLLKTSRNGEILGYDQPSSCTAYDQGQNAKMPSTLEIPSANGNFIEQQFHGTNPNENSSVTQSNVELQLDALGVGNSDKILNADAALGASNNFCKKEPADDGGNSVDEAPDFTSFDEELYEFLDGIGRDGDLPADILQVLNQGELDSINFHHDTLLNQNDISLTPVGEAASCTTSKSSVHQSLGFVCGDIKSSDCNRLSPLSDCPITGPNQVSVNMTLGQKLINDGAGPAAETLKQMAARRNQVTPMPGVVCQQNHQLSSLQTYTCSLPLSCNELDPALNVTPIQAAEQYSLAMTDNCVASQLPSLYSSIQQLHDVQTDYLVNQINSYTVETGFSDGTSKLPLQSHVQSLYTHYPSSNNRDSIPFTNCFQNHKLQVEKDFASSDANYFNSESLTGSSSQNQQYCSPPTQNSSSSSISTAALSYLQTVGRNTNSTMSHHHLHHLATHSRAYIPRLQTGDQMAFNSSLIKMSLPAQYVHFNSSAKIKMEDGLSFCGTKNASNSGGGQTSLQSYRHNSVGCNFSGMSYAYEGTFPNQLTQHPILQPTLSPYIKDYEAKTPNGANAYSNLISASLSNVQNIWMNSAAFNSSPNSYAEDSIGQSFATTNSPSPHLGEHQQVEKCRTFPLSYHIQRQQVLTSSSRPWSSSESQMGSNNYHSSTSDVTLSNSNVLQKGHAYQRQISVADGANAVFVHTGTDMIVHGQNLADNQHPSLPRLSNSHLFARQPPSVDQFLSCVDADGFFSSLNQKQRHESVNQSIEISLIEDFVNGK